MGIVKRYGYNIEEIQPQIQTQTQTQSRGISFRKGVVEKAKGLKYLGQTLKSGVAVVFAEDLIFSQKKIFDPQDRILQIWNRILVVICFLALSVDPLLFYVPYIDDTKSCLDLEVDVSVFITISRSILDLLYAFRIAFQFRTAFEAPSSRVLGRGELVIDPKEIAKRYLRRGTFVIDIISILPLPQISIWQYLYANKNVVQTKKALLYIVLVQYIPRFLRVLPIASELQKTVGVFVESAFFGAIAYLFLFILTSHIAGSFWYLLAIHRNIECMEVACIAAPDFCNTNYLVCSNDDAWKFPGFWLNGSASFYRKACSAENEVKYGIYRQALDAGVFSEDKFVPKVLYCLWWGLQNLSTLGQGLETSLRRGEILFSIGVAIFGLVFFALLIGNMQTYLQSLSLRIEEMRVKRRDSEQWMHHRALPQQLRERVRRYDQYRWVETRGVDEQSLVQSLPKDLRKDIKRHLCMNLVKRVPLFSKMDERLLDAICEKLRPSLYTEKTYIVREGDPVEEIVVILRGHLESETTDGGRSGFYNRTLLKEGDFCGDELLTWSLDPKTGSSLPSSNRTVMSLTEVEAFVLSADDMKFVASQFRRLHNRQVQNTFRYYSQQWRTWAAIYIQSSWKRYIKRKLLSVEDEEEEVDVETEKSSSTSFGATIYASRFATNALRRIQRLRSANASKLVQLQKPRDPDFGSDYTL